LVGFSVLIGTLSAPILHLLLPPPRLENLLAEASIAPETLVTVGQSLPALAALLLFFRFVFGWFLRNFERQADLRVIEIMGDGRALVSTFELLADSGGDREQSSWHHFGLGERIRAIETAEADPQYSARHDKKVGRALAGYFFVVVFLTAIYFSFHGGAWQLDEQYETAIGVGTLRRQIRLHPEDGCFPLALADFQAQRGNERQALASYETAVKAFPGMAEILNNFAWFLVTCHDPTLRDPKRALTMAQLAVAAKPEGNTHDTLATVYWANGLTDMAASEQLRAIAADPENRRHYLRRLDAFRAMSYQESLEKAEKEQKPTLRQETDHAPRGAANP
ncbi:MAG: peptidase M48 Ste24p, partial [Desulfobulbaceae bacterium]|jgi:tetratricopeptide (TPR) repeat protein|nr:peptidase M48 Ste24p [Desulfobulbaceae bacterium]